jgi:hypothetical protein
MRKYIAIVAGVLCFVSCKTKQAALPTGEPVAAEAEKSAKDVAAGHYTVPRQFSTLYIRADAKYKDSKQSQSVSAEIRMKKDETILVSVRFLGITMAKALITPQRVSYYEKINGKYFEGNYAMLSRWLGTELNFTKVQNMLLGLALEDLEKGSYKSSLEGDQYKLVSNNKGIVGNFFIGGDFLLRRQSVAQGGQQPRSLEIQYHGYKAYQQAVLPTDIRIEAEQKDRVNLQIQYKTVTFDEKLTFPYEVPEGFDQIFLD